jgi:phosphatidylethanolamine/phosphatidyl-N-methylethanolamine N-methyltransferase
MTTGSPLKNSSQAVRPSDGRRKHGPRSRRLHFVVQYLRHPKQVGAIAPSSPSLAAAMTRQKWFNEAKSVVELGPGDGPVTAAIRHRLNANQHTFFALEINESLCHRLRERFPDVKVYCDSAAEIGKYLKLNGASHADLVVSSIPWAAFDAKLQKELMDAILASMRPGGRFITFTYVFSPALPSGRRFRQFLGRTFSSVSCSPVIWRNFPPAIVYECIK